MFGDGINDGRTQINIGDKVVSPFDRSVDATIALILILEEVLLAQRRINDRSFPLLLILVITVVNNCDVSTTSNSTVLKTILDAHVIGADFRLLQFVSNHICDDRVLG